MLGSKLQTLSPKRTWWQTLNPVWQPIRVLRRPVQRPGFVGVGMPRHLADPVNPCVTVSDISRRLKHVATIADSKE